MIRYGFFFGWLIVINPIHAEIYKWTDSNGTVQWSDTPHSGAKQVILLPQETNSSLNAPFFPSPSSQIADKLGRSVQKTVTISQPKSEETIRNNQGYFPVVTTVEPGLEKGERMQVLLDGQLLGKAQPTQLFSFDNVLRGEHKIVVQLLDKDNNVITSSEPITIYMHRPRIGMVHQTHPGN